MKNILKILSISIILFVAISCNEDEFLQENPKDKVYVTLYSSYSGFKVGLNGLYALVRDQYQGYWEQLFMVSTDNAWVSTAGSGELAPFRNYSDLAPAMAKKNLPGSVMTWLYQVINASNVIISRAQNPGVNWEGGSDAINEANKNFVIAQARLLRAYAYRFLTNGWGDIPLVLDEPEGPRDDWSRTPVADVRQAMEEDFLFAVNHLPMKDVQGIPNAAVACHYLLELYLTIGYAKKDNSFYVKAETMADNVINSGKYSLLTNFSDNFKKDVNGGNTECLWFTNNAYSDVIGSFGGENKKARHSYPDKIIKN